MKNGKVDKYLFAGGYAQASVASATTDNFAFYFYNQDHLGNIREVVDASGAVKQVNNYYPFGAPYADTSATTSPDFQPYKYNGKELDRMHRLDLYDYGARQYDPVIGQFTQIDLLCEKYYHISPYAYCANNPVKYIDPDGRDGVVSIYGNNIEINANIYLYGSGATKAVKQQMQKDVNKVWGKKHSIDYKGAKYNVIIKISIDLYGGKEKNNPSVIYDSWNPFSRNNYIRAADDCQRSYTRDSDEGQWRSIGRNKKPLSKDDPAPHEVGHILGLDDQYSDEGGPNKGWEDNIMANGISGKVDNRNINDILKDVWQKYDDWLNNGNTGVFRYEINP